MNAPDPIVAQQALAELTRLQPARTEGPRALQAMEPAQR